MKKYLVFGMMGAMALTFTACSSEDDLANAKQTFDGKTVKTQLAVSLPGKINPKTRMDADAVQNEANSFRGITDLKFFPFVVGSKGDIVEAETSYSGANIELEGGDITEFDHGTTNDKWYDAALPIKTNAVLIYAKADGGGDFTEGNLKATIDLANIGETPADKVKFELVPVNTTSLSSGDGQTITDNLDKIATVKGKVNGEDTEVNWSDIDEDVNATYVDLYERFTSLTAGSSASVVAMLEDLAATLEHQADQTEGSLTANLKNAVDKAITAISALDFPGSLNLPDGAAKLTFEDGKFTYVEGENTLGDDESGDNEEMKYGYNTYVYPAELYYRANSLIKASNEKQSDNIKDDVDWTEGVIDELYADADDEVMPTTQSVAVVDQLQYAVANLKTLVRIGSDEVTTNEAIDGDQDNLRKIAVPSEGLTITGILVGGQQNVDFEFHRTESTEYVVYDKELIEDAVEVNDSFDEDAPISYTLLLESEEGEDVMIALEFENNFVDEEGNEVDFVGVNGQIIPFGTKFYLVGKLEVSNDNTGENRVFIQDYRTVAKFTISSVKNAYNVVPDLRTPELELGLSVNLEWQDGAEYEIEF